MWNIIAPIAGAVVAGYFNNAAAERAGEATLEGSRITAEAIDRASRQGQETLRELRAEGQPGVAYLRRVVASPGDLTPAQTKGLDEVRRGVTNQIHSSGFAGSGRTAAALFRKTESDYVTDALEKNRDRAYQAASGMASTATNAMGGIAKSQIDAGTAIGKVQGEAYGKAGLYDAQADLATGNVMGRAIGDIGSAITNEARESRYTDRLKRIETSLGIK